MRLDQALTQHHLAPTRSQAQLLIREEKVSVNGKLICKTSHQVSDSDTIEVKDDLHFVGRGAQKMLAALDAFNIDPQNKILADVGASTGGFTQVLLERGAKKVYAIDVGHGQLAPSLTSHPRVVNLEGINIRHGLELPEKVDMLVADLSFISLRLVMQPMRHLAKPGADFILLFKPQFEVGKEHITKSGVVKNERIRKKALNGFLEGCREEGWSIQGVMDSPIVGKAGNREFLVWMNFR